LSVVFAVLFIVGEMAGSGILALPRAVANSGYVGLLMLVICACIAGYTGCKLGKCWEYILQKEPAERDAGDPYPTIAKISVGRKTEILANCSVYFTLVGACIVLLILCSINIRHIINGIAGSGNIPICLMILIIGISLIPFGWLKSPAEMPWIAFLAAVTTFIACIFITIQLIFQGHGFILSEDVDEHRADFYNVSIPDVIFQGSNCSSDDITQFIVPCTMDVFSAFGKILFCFGGMAVFPSIQVDMRMPEKFTQVVVISMSSIVSMMIPVAMVGYYFFASNVPQNILEQADPRSFLAIAANVLITSHLLFAFVIIQNPIAQRVEIPFNVKTFGPRRIGIRSAISLAMIFLATSCPKFDFILDLVGGTTVTLNTFIFPCVFYICLIHKYAKKGDPIKDADGLPVTISKWEYAFQFVVITIGLTCGLLSTSKVLLKAFSDGVSLKPPCYVDPFLVLESVNH